MAVAFDSVGPSSAGTGRTTNGTLSWSHTTAGASTSVYVGAELDNSTTAQPASCTIDGNAMTSIGIIAAQGANTGFCQVFRATGIAAGAHTIVVTPNLTATDLAAGSIAVTGEIGIGTVFTATSAGSRTVTGTTSGGLVLGFAASGDSINATTAPATSRYVDNLMAATGADAGNIAGATSPSTGGTVTMAWTLNTANTAGIIAFESLGATVQQNAVPHGGKGWRRNRGKGRRPATPVIRPSLPAGAYLAGSGLGPTSVGLATQAGDGIFVSINANGAVTALADSAGNTYVQLHSDTASNAYLYAATYKGSPGTPTSANPAGSVLTITTGATVAETIITGCPGLAPQPADANPAFATATSGAASEATGTLSNPVEFIVSSVAAAGNAYPYAWLGPMVKVLDLPAAAPGSASMAVGLSSSTGGATITAQLASSQFWDQFVGVFLFAGQTGGVPPGTATLTASVDLTAAPAVIEQAGTTLAAAAAITAPAVSGLAPATLIAAAAVNTPAVLQLAPATLAPAVAITPPADRQIVPATLTVAMTEASPSVLLAPATLIAAVALGSPADIQASPASILVAGALAASGGGPSGAALSPGIVLSTAATQLAPASLAAAVAITSAALQLAPATLAAGMTVNSPLAVQLAPAILAALAQITPPASSLRAPAALSVQAQVISPVSAQLAAASLLAAASITNSARQLAVATLGAAAVVTASQGATGAAVIIGGVTLTGPQAVQLAAAQLAAAGVLSGPAARQAATAILSALTAITGNVTISRNATLSVALSITASGLIKARVSYGTAAVGAGPVPGAVPGTRAPAGAVPGAGRVPGGAPGTGRTPAATAGAGSEDATALPGGRPS